jgi:hypothetical protein
VFPTGRRATACRPYAGANTHNRREHALEHGNTLKLNLGSGDTPLPGYVNVDRKTGGEVYPLAGYADGSVDEIRASHVLEHFSHRDVFAVLTEWTRVLKFGGTLKLAVPDLEWIARNYLDGKPVNVQGYLMGGHTDGDDRHGCTFDHECLSEMLRKLGYRDLKPWRSDIADCASLPVSLNIRATKWYRIKPLMSVPRLGFMDNFFAWAEALTPLGLLPSRYTGAFWGQCLERVMETEAGNADLFLTIDYDTPVRLDDIQTLIRLMHEHPDADAIAPLQMGRERTTPLMTVNGADGQPLKAVARDEFDRDLMPAATAHFGCTIIRTAGLAKMPHPWFLGQPNADGRWGEGRVDDDIYFWRQWTGAGNTLFVTPRVVVGHGEYVFTWPDENLQPIHQHPTDFFKSGPPAGTFRPAPAGASR